MAAKSDTDAFDKLPAPEDFLLKVPLYEAFRFNDEVANPFFAIEHFKGALDCFCLGCNRHSVFNRIGESNYSEFAHTYNHIFILWFSCSREQGHRIAFLFRSHQGILQKIGQFPSLADLAAPDLQKYRPVLGDERFRELNRAVGLAAHGVGIGALVYMRRIFEALVESARVIAERETSWDQDSYDRARMDEKIAILKDYLPAFLVENRALYGIMSVGVHTLAEQECLAAFPVVRLGIELMLDDQLDKAKRERKLKDASQSIAVLKGR